MDIFTKQGLKREALDEIVRENRFRHAQTKDILVLHEKGQFKYKNLVTKREKQEQAKNEK